MLLCSTALCAHAQCLQFLSSDPQLFDESLWQEEEKDGPPTSADPAESASAAAEPAAAQEAGKQGGKGKKRSGEDIIEREKERSKKAKEAATKKAEWFELKQNTSVYVSGLPSDVTEEEVAQVIQVHENKAA